MLTTAVAPVTIVGSPIESGSRAGLAPNTPAHSLNPLRDGWLGRNPQARSRGGAVDSALARPKAKVPSWV